MSRRNSRQMSKRKRARAAGPTPPAFLDRLAERADRLARTRWAFPTVLVVLVLAIYARSFPLGLVDFDDDVYLFEDARLESLSLGNIGRIIVRPFLANYHPVTTLTYALDRAVWGRWIPGFRLTQLAFYAGGVVLLYYLFRKLLGSAWAAFAAAAIYATHAIHVEAVAWLAQRKDVVCLVFYAASILAYLRYSGERERPWRPYAASLALAVLAMLSKGYAVVLPAVLFAYDLCFAERTAKRRVLDKLPYLAASLAVTVLTILSQEEVKALLESPYTLWERFVLLCKVFAAYVGRTFLPVRLSALYMTGRWWLGGWAAALGLLLGLGSVAGFFLLRRKQPAIAFGIALFLLPLATVMNVFFTLRIWIADRYLFSPTIGSSLALAACAVWLCRRKRLSARARSLVPGLTGAATVALYSALTIARIGVWRGPVELWSDAVRRHSGLSGSGPVTANELARAQPRRLSRRLITALAQAYGRTGNVEEAKALLAGVKKPSKDKETGSELALARLAVEKGRHDEAIELALKTAEGGTWAAPRGWGLVGLAYAEKGDYDAAREAFLKSLELYRESGRSGAKVMQDLGLVELRTGNREKAAEWYRRAREAAPADPGPAFGLAVTCEQVGRLREALDLYEEILRLKPDHPQREAIEATVARLRRELAAPESREGRR